MIRRRKIEFCLLIIVHACEDGAVLDILLIHCALSALQAYVSLQHYGQGQPIETQQHPRTLSPLPLPCFGRALR